MEKQTNSKQNQNPVNYKSGGLWTIIKNLIRLGEKCTLCSKKFHLFRLKHSCRICFKLVCADCSRGTGRQRICSECRGVVVVFQENEKEQVEQQQVQETPNKPNEANQLQQDNNTLQSQSIDSSMTFSLSQQLADKLGLSSESLNAFTTYESYASLPMLLQNLIEMNGISKEEAQSNPAAAFGALLFSMSSPPAQEIIQSINSYAVKIKQKNPELKYELVKQLGKGRQGVVFVGLERKNKKEVAIKQMFITNETSEQYIINEIQTMSLAKHPNIISCFEVFYYDNSFWVVEELMETNLTKIIERRNFANEAQIAYILWSILQALVYLHSQHKIHRDIKSDNIFITQDGKIKLGDFGYCAQLTAEKDRKTSIVGTPSWMAPELIMGKRYDSKVDIWSLGIVVIEICKGQPPFFGLPPVKTLFFICTSDPPKLDVGSEDLKDITHQCLQKEPGMRSTASILQNHKFLNKKCSQNEFAAFLKGK